MSNRLQEFSGLFRTDPSVTYHQRERIEELAEEIFMDFDNNCLAPSHGEDYTDSIHDELARFVREMEKIGVRVDGSFLCRDEANETYWILPAENGIRIKPAVTVLLTEEASTQIREILEAADRHDLAHHFIG